MDGDDDLIERATTARGALVRMLAVGDPSPIEKAQESLLDTASSTSKSTATAVAHVDGMINPPYDPRTLCRLFEHSNALRPNVDAYATNIDGFGHSFEPVFDPEDDDAADNVRNAIIIERMMASRRNATKKRLQDVRKASGDKLPAAASIVEPTEIEVEKRLEQIRAKMRIEKFVLERFFEECVDDQTFTALRMRTRSDKEVTGNAFWEVIRDDAGTISQFVLAPSRTMRLRSRGSDRVEATRYVRTGPFDVVEEVTKKRFRSFVQLGDDGGVVYFKEFGDRRTMSSKTGKIFANDATLAADPDDGGQPANEIIHFSVHALSGAYGVPRWIGTLISVLGSRQAEEVNFLYFENKSIPPLVVTVSGGTLSADCVSKLQSQIENEIKGKRNFHKILILEAESPASSATSPDTAARVRIEVKPLTDALGKDALFQGYDERNIDKVGMHFRMPRLARGDVRDFNRATADASLTFAEGQVFRPERNEFDHLMNAKILPELGITLWAFRSNGVQISDSTTWSEAIAKLTTAGILTPKDARELAGRLVFNKTLSKIDADWINQPLAMTVAGYTDFAADDEIPLQGSEPDTGAQDQQHSGAAAAPKKQPAPAPPTKGAAVAKLRAQARGILRLRDELVRQEAQMAKREHAAARAEEDDTVVIKMTRAELAAIGVEFDECAPEA